MRSTYAACCFVIAFALLCGIWDVHGVEVQDHKKSNISCSTCDDVISQLEDFLQANSTITEVSQYVDSWCEYIPMEKECKQLVGNYTSKFIQMLVDEDSPQDICAYIDICNRTVNPMVGNSTECDLCQWILSQLAGFVDNKATEHEIIETLLAVCDLVKKEEKKPCVTLMKTYGDSIIDMVLKKATPDVACIELDLCAKGSPWAN